MAPETPEPSARLSAIEVLVVVMLLGMLALILLMAAPRQREVARLASCRQNLMTFGVALALYDQSERQLPEVPALGPDPATAPAVDSPQKALLRVLGVADLRTVAKSKQAARDLEAANPVERPVPGFVCPSDPNAMGGAFSAPISYRACAGSTPDGRDGPFAPGRRLALATIEAGDGLGYTAGFAERLVGTNRPVPALPNYAVVPGPLPESGCPPAGPDSWRGDAGSSWGASDWRSTLYNHALTPSAMPSCVAEERRSAFLGASSGHVGGVNVLILDGSVRTITPRIAPRLWRDLGSVRPPAAPARAAPGD